MERTRRISHAVDWPLLGLCLCCNGFGLVLLYSASRFQSAYHTLPQKQLLSSLLGIILFFLCTKLDPERLMAHWIWVLVGLVTLLCTLLTPLGTAGDTGNRSWLAIPGVPFHLQPAELGRLLDLLLVAWQLHRFQEIDPRPAHLLGLLGHLVGITGLIFLLSGDGGMVVVYGSLFLLLCWLSGIPTRWFCLLGGMGGGMAVVLWNVLPAENYWKRRFLVLFHHDLDPQGVGFQQSRSLTALGSGGLTGQGLFHGTLTQSTAASSLPARYTDFIFSVCGEELGFLGCLACLLLLTLVVLRCGWIGNQCQSSFCSRVALGCGGMIALQTLLNVGMCLYVAPVIGLTLPFFSYGGSSLLSLYMAMGVVSGISSRTPPPRLR